MRRQPQVLFIEGYVFKTPYQGVNGRSLPSLKIAFSVFCFGIVTKAKSPESGLNWALLLYFSLMKYVREEAFGMATDKFINAKRVSSSSKSSGLLTDEVIENLSRDQLITLLKLQKSSISKMKEQIDEKDAAIDNLTEQVKYFKGMLFGVSSEKGVTKKFQTEGQLSFVANAVNELEITADQPEDDASNATTKHVNGYDRHQHGKKHVGKKAADLSAIEVHRDVDDIIPEEELKKIFPDGKWVTMEYGQYSLVDIIPASAVCITHHLKAYKGSDGRIVKAPHAPTLLNNSIVTPSFIASAVNAKFGNYMPLHRYWQALQYMKVFVSTHDLCNELITVGDRYCMPMYNRMTELLHQFHVLNIDETPCIVRHGNSDKGRKRAYMWIYRSGKFETAPPITIFKYEKSRATIYPREFLSTFHHIVCVTDGLKDYHVLDREREDLTFAGCYAHVRRKFVDAVKVSKKGDRKQTIAAEAVAKIDEIFDQDKLLKDLSPEERYQKRLENIKPLVDSFFSWLKEVQKQVLSKSKTGEAIGYALNEEEYLRKFLTDGSIPLDNNQAELGCRSFVMGRKNFYVIDTERGADMTAVYYSLTETAKQNKLNPYRWFEYFLTQMINHPDRLNDTEFLDSLMPWSDSIPESARLQPEPEIVPVDKTTKGHKTKTIKHPIEEITGNNS